MEIDAAPQSWFEAFDLLIDFLSGKPKTEKIIVFIDEMPWLDTPKSGFVTAFEHFWNGWAAGQDNLLLVACGSATTWIVDRLLSNKGGLYNRVTQEMHLVPFTLKECEEYYREHGVVMIVTTKCNVMKMFVWCMFNKFDRRWVYWAFSLKLLLGIMYPLTRKWEHKLIC